MTTFGNRHSKCSAEHGNFGHNGSCYPSPGGPGEWGHPGNDIAPVCVPVEFQEETYGKDITCNFEGPFCHRGEQGRWDKVILWNGGGNSNQGSPFTCYSSSSFLKQTGDMDAMNVSEDCKSAQNSVCTATECALLKPKAEEIAQGICDQVA